MSFAPQPPYRLLVVACDPLVRAGLSALASQSTRTLVVGQVQPDDNLYAGAATYDAYIILWDFSQLDEESENWLATFHTESSYNIPVIALADDPGVANRLWHMGIRAVARRTVAAEELEAAIDATANGFRVLDMEFSGNGPTAPSSLDALPVEPLTPRELEVLQLLAEGLSNKQVARKLSISEHTVKFHVNAILGKFDVQSRTEAVVYATRVGLIFL